jgi:mutator protein MutT
MTAPAEGPRARAYPDRPIVGVGAVVVTEAGVVLVKRRNEPLAGKWSLPGGAVELGETLQEAVVREVREETGLDVSVGPVVEVLDRIHRDADGRIAYHYVLVDYSCTPRGGAPRAASDATDVAVVADADLASYGVAAATIAVIRKGLGMARG